MATFAITASINFSDLFGATGSDVYNINSASVLTIDSDCRYGSNRTAITGPVGAMTIDAATGGTIFIDGTKVRIISYTGGSGNVPASGTLITQTGGATGTLLGCWPSFILPPTDAGVALSASGYIKIKNVTGSFVSGTALGGITATANAADRVGWIEVPGSDSTVINVPRLGKFIVTGSWFEAGVTSGGNSQTMQLPASLALTYGYAGVWVETGLNTNVFEPWPNIGTATATAIGTDDRGKCVIISSQGLVTFGTGTARKIPVSGSRVRVPNVLLINTTTANLAVNVLPNATLATRHAFLTSGSGDINIQMANIGWGQLFSQPYAVKYKNVGVLTNINVSECASALDWDGVCVGQEAANIKFGLTMASCFAGGTISNSVFTATSLASSGRYVASISNITGITWNNNTILAFASRANATTGAQTIINALNCTWNSCSFMQGQTLLTTCVNCTFNATKYADDILAIAGTLYPMNVFSLVSKCNTIKIDGLSWVSGTSSFRPYTGLVSVNASDYVKIRNIGSPTGPLQLNQGTATGVVVTHAGNSSNVEVKRVYVQNTRTGISTAINSDKYVTYENVWGDYADPIVEDNLVFIRKGNKCGSGVIPLTAVAVYGTHFVDCFTSDISGRILLHMNEPTIETAQYVSYSLDPNGSGFTSLATLKASLSGDAVEWTWPYYIRGYTGLANAGINVSGTNVANHRFDFQIDTGTGFAGSWLTASAANLSAVTGILSGTGFRPKIKVTCTASSDANLIQLIWLSGTHTTASMQVQYPLDTVSAAFTMQGIYSGSEVRIYNSATMTELTGTESIVDSPTGSFTYSYTWDSDAGDITGIVVIHSLGYQSVRFNTTFGSGSNTIPIQQQVDRQYNNPA